MKRYSAFALLCTLIGCADATTGPGVEIGAAGAFTAVTYLDRNDNNVLDADESVLAGVPVVLVRGAADTVMRRVTNATGIAEFRNVAAGSYRVATASSAVTDSLTSSAQNEREITIAANDTAESLIAFVYPSATIRSARTLPLGKRVQLRVTALHGWSSFGDSTLHLTDSTGTLRATAVRPANFGAGDVVRVVGTTANVSGQPAIRDVTVLVVGVGSAPAPRSLTTLSAASANGGELDAALVKIANAAVVGWQVSAGDVIVTVNDGSGKLEVLMDRDAGLDLSRMERGATLNATGVLVPARTTSVWQLKPRSGSDIDLTLPLLSVGDVRSAEIGRRVRVKAAALHSWATFGDGTLHVKDGSGSLRAVAVQQVSVFAGDTVEVTGTVAAEAGQAVLRDAVAQVIAMGVVPAPENVTLSVGRTASGGRLDAALVRLPVASVTDTITVGRDFGLTLTLNNDTVRVILDADAGFAPAQYPVGSGLEVTGLLVPNVTGSAWLVKPRNRADVIIRSVPAAAARPRRIHLP